MKPRGQGPYLIVDPQGRSRTRLIAELEAVIRAGAGLVQLRDKSSWGGESRDFAERVLAICRQTRVPLLINDDPIRAHALGADGVHLGRTDPGIGFARALLGEESIIGASAYGDLERGRAAAREGADYIAFGSIYPSPTKPDATRLSLDSLRNARQSIDTPICAIGGIRPDNARPVVRAGADWLAVISGVWDAENPALAMRDLAHAFQPAQGEC
ncbi:MAG: thiamine phosphate synthase [Gammaproteobacteria bacterium]